MIQRFFSLVAGLLAGMILMTLTAFAQLEINELLPDSPTEWTLQEGDWIIANVAENTLQFVRKDNSAISRKVEIGSGINEGKNIYYLGMSYDPITPEETWEIRSKVQQRWWNVFGSRESDEQLFLRLYRIKGEQRIETYYGFHTTPDIETIFDEKDGFGSWGCVLTRYDLLKMIEELYELNGEVIKVVTTSLDSPTILAMMEEEAG